MNGPVVGRVPRACLGSRRLELGMSLSAIGVGLLSGRYVLGLEPFASAVVGSTPFLFLSG